jgi:putative alpha-1,2-mannosidase
LAFAERSQHPNVASRVGYLRFTFSDTQTPYVFLEATRASVIGSSNPHNVTYPSGSITIDPAACEISGSNAERQDFIIGPNPAERFSGYFVARFDAPFVSFGTTRNGTVRAGERAARDHGDGEGLLGGYVIFRPETRTVNVRIGVSFISVEQARRNLDSEIPDGTRLEQTAKKTRTEWAEKLDRVRVEGGSQEQLETFYTAIFHTLQAFAPLCSFTRVVFH